MAPMHAGNAPAASLVRWQLVTVRVLRAAVGWMYSRFPLIISVGYEPSRRVGCSAHAPLCCLVLCRIGMKETKIVAKIENMEGLVNYAEIMKQCDIMLLSRGSMGNCIDAEKMFLAQKMLLRVRRDTI